MPAGWGADASAAKARATAAAAPPPAPAPRTGQCTVQQLISALLRQQKQADEPQLFELRIMEDDGTPDLDFPELDKTVSVTAFGVDQFVMCRVGDWSEVVLEVQLLSSAGAQLQLEFKVPGGTAQQMVIGATPQDTGTPTIAVRNLDSGQGQACARAANSSFCAPRFFCCALAWRSTLTTCSTPLACSDQGA